MTEDELRYKAAHFLDPYKGCAEGSALHKELIDMYNNSGLCPRYKMTIYDAWCATAVSDCFIGTGLTGIFPCVECSCANMITLAQAAGIWVEDDTHVPNIGAVVLYDWDDSGSGDNTGVPDHVGIVQSVSGSTFVVIEGNKSDTVGTRTMQVNGRYIRGFIEPNYAAAADGATDTSTSTPTGTPSKSVDEIAQEVIIGQWGNDPERTAALTAAGYDAAAVQARVNEIFGAGTGSTDSAGIAYANSFENGHGSGTKYTVTAQSGLNVRKGPGTGYDIIDALTKGSTVIYYGYYDKDSAGDKWLLVISNGQTGWVCAKYVS